MDIYITGRGNSGTTFVADLISELGFDMGIDLKNAADNHGREWMPLAVFSRALNRKYALERDTNFPFGNIFDAQSRSSMQDWANDEIQKVLNKNNVPEVVKLPEEGQSIVLDRLDPDMTIVVVRNPGDWVESIKEMNWMENYTLPSHIQENYMFLDLGRLFYYLTIYDLPFTVIEYPRAVKEPVYVWDKLCPVVREFKDVSFVDFFEAWQDVVNEDWIR